MTNDVERCGNCYIGAKPGAGQACSHCGAIRCGRCGMTALPTSSPMASGVVDKCGNCGETLRLRTSVGENVPLERYISVHARPTGLDRELIDVTREEITEVIRELLDLDQRLSKILRFGAEEVQEGQDLTNAQRASVEYGQLQWCMNQLQARGIIELHYVLEGIKEKARKFPQFQQEDE